MFKKLAITANLIACLTSVSTAQAAETCFDLSLDSETGPSLLRPAFGECQTIQNALKQGGKFPNIFTKQGNRLHEGLCFSSSADDPSKITSGIHGKLGDKPVTIDIQAAWTNQFTPNLPPYHLSGQDNLASVITQWSLYDAKHKPIGTIYTTDIIDTNRLLSQGLANELNVVVGGSKNLSAAKGSVRVDSRLNEQQLVEITAISGQLCLPKSK